MRVAVLLHLYSVAAMHLAAPTSSMPAMHVAQLPRTRAVATAVATAVGAVDVPSTDEWVSNLDLDAFGSDVRALGRELASQEGEADLNHFRTIRRWSNVCGIFGVLTMALPLNPLTVLALSTWVYSRWTMVAHHTCHGGYDVHEGDRYCRRLFALGGPVRRARDWLDWMLPEAWNLEHNVLHHYKLGEVGDPDLVERNLGFVREWRGPLVAKYAFVAAMAAVWKWVYYAPNTYKQLKLSEYQREHDGASPTGLDPHAALTLGKLVLRPKLRGGLFTATDFLGRVMLPVLVLRFMLLPAPLLLLPGGLGAKCYANALANLVVADLVTNLHSFLTIVTNHAGDDLYRFDDSCAPNSPEFFLRQVLSSANYRTGGDANDFWHGFLNYQVEHQCVRREHT